MHPKSNIIFISMDCVRADRMGFAGHKKNITPFIDSLAKKGVYFDNAFATGPGSSVSFVGVLTSTYPLDHGGFSRIEEPRVMVSELLKNGGYETIAIHSSAYFSGYFGYDRGWDKFSYVSHFRSKTGSINPGLRRETAKAKALKISSANYEWLKRRLPPLASLYRAVETMFLLLRKILKDILNYRPAFFIAEEINGEVRKVLPKKPEKPLFLWVHYMDAHTPYALLMRRGYGALGKIMSYFAELLLFLFYEAPFLNRMFLPLYKNLYDKSLRYIDDNIKQLFSYLEAIGINEDNSVFVITADHGEAFMEHGHFGHPQVLFRVHLKVPLVFCGSGGSFPRGSVKRPVSLIDLSPTFLSIAGVDKPDFYRGVSIFDEKPRDVVSQASESEGDLSCANFTGAAIIRNGYRLFHWKDKRCLFSVEDEEEKENLYDSRKDIVENLEERLKEYAPKQELNG